jgi:predicted transcriptional regulator
METDVPSVHPGLTVDTFAAQLLDGDTPTTALPVVQGSEVVGILGVRQVQRLRPAEWPTSRVEDVMAKPPRLPLVDQDDGLVSAVEKLQRAGLDGLPVMDDDRLVGVLTRRSIGLAVQARTGNGRGGEPGSGATSDGTGADDEGGRDAAAGPDPRDRPGPDAGAPA